MHKDQAYISFFKQPKICSNPKHKISFDDMHDKYNPFSMHNFIVDVSLDMNKCEEVVDCIMPILIENDLRMQSSVNWFQIPQNKLKSLQSAATNNFSLSMKKFADKHVSLLSSMKPKWDYVQVNIAAHMLMNNASIVLHMQALYSKHIAAFEDKNLFVIQIVLE